MCRTIKPRTVEPPKVVQKTNTAKTAAPSKGSDNEQERSGPKSNRS
jgi:hypothetical protein